MPGPRAGDIFTRRRRSTLRMDGITQGIDAVVTFTGSAFDGAPRAAKPLLMFPKG